MALNPWLEGELIVSAGDKAPGVHTILARGAIIVLLPWQAGRTGPVAALAGMPALFWGPGTCTDSPWRCP